MAQCIKTWLVWLSDVLRSSSAWQRTRNLHGPGLLMLAGEAWVSIGNNRLRTFLAILGIVIGVGAVVLMMGIGTASQRKVERTISALGTNLLIITAKPIRVSNRNRYEFDTGDVAAIAELPLAEAVAYSSFPSNRTASVKSLNVQAQIIGTIPEYLPMRNWVLADGNAFTLDDLRQGSRVAVIGQRLAQELFNGENPLGRSLAIGEARIHFQVVGILEPKEPGLSGEDQDNVAFVPITAFKSYFGTPFQGGVQIIYAKAVSAEVLEDLSEAIRDVLRQRRKIPEAQPDDFSIQNVNSVLQVASETTKVFSTLLTAIASISLLVGGIGIMNIMLVTVAERTREIGIRKAIGATEQHILTQFLLEAVMIAAAGSVLGLIVGVGAGLAAEHWFSLPMAFSPWSVALALGMAVAIGLPSGIYPAHKAARMQPIEALRAT